MATVNSLEPAGLGSSWGTAPDDGTQVKAGDVRSAAQLLLTNDEAIRRGHLVHYVDVEEKLTTPFDVDVIGNTPFQDTVLECLVQDAAVSDDIEISFCGCVQMNSSVGGPNAGVLRFFVIEDDSGVATGVAVPGLMLLPDPAGTNYTVSMRAVHRLSLAGNARVKLQAETIDLTGGAGTGSLVFLYSQRLDVRHIKRKAAITNET